MTDRDREGSVAVTTADVHARKITSNCISGTKIAIAEVKDALVQRCVGSHGDGPHFT